jgi:hypothetical protein
MIPISFLNLFYKLLNLIESFKEQFNIMYLNIFKFPHPYTLDEVNFIKSSIKIKSHKVII